VESEKEKVNLNGTMDRPMKETGMLEGNMEMDVGKVLLGNLMKVSGKEEDNMAKELIRINLAHIKENL
jgi:predicted NUDIX family phosphoesterase